MHGAWPILGIPCGLEGCTAPNSCQREAWREQTGLGLVSIISDQKMQPTGREPLVMRTPTPKGQFSGSRCPRHSEMQGGGEVLTGIQAQKKGCQISELSEAVAVGLWLLFGQAVGVRPVGTHVKTGMSLLASSVLPAPRPPPSALVLNCCVFICTASAR